jgi:hypothetical protein
MSLEAQTLNQVRVSQKKATIASPIGFAPMMRKSTAMIVALLRAIQPRTVSSGSWDRAKGGGEYEWCEHQPTR